MALLGTLTGAVLAWFIIWMWFKFSWWNWRRKHWNEVERRWREAGWID